MSLAPTQTFYSEIAQNRRQSVLLVLVLMVILGVLGLAIGYGLTGDVTERPAGDGRRHHPGRPAQPGLVLRRRQPRARGVPGAGGGRPERAAADERGARAVGRRQPAHAARLHHQRPLAERVRHRSRPAARLRGHHHGPPPEARPRAAPGRHRPRDVARAQPGHPVRPPRGRAGGRHRPHRRRLPALHVLGRPVAAAGAAATRAGEGAGPRPSSSSWPSCWPSWPPSSGPSSSWP